MLCHFSPDLCHSKAVSVRVNCLSKCRRGRSCVTPPVSTGLFTGLADKSVKQADSSARRTARLLCRGHRTPPSRRGRRGRDHRPLPIDSGSPAHPDVSINHRVDALTAPFPGFHARILPVRATDSKLHFWPIHRESRTITSPGITLSRTDGALIRAYRSRCSARRPS
jgi:hypothetical protein